MLSSLQRYLLFGVMTVALWIGWGLPAGAATNPAELATAVESIEQLNALRSGLAATLEGSTEVPTPQTMKEVCKPVGMQAQHLSQEHGWQVKQIASKYRNPAHAPSSPYDEAAIAQFEEHPDLTGFWERETLNGQVGTRYYRRIDVEASCLACHGGKDERPPFVQQNYPDDRAYDFQVGDLRGMYAVFMPDVQQAIEAALTDGGAA